MTNSEKTQFGGELEISLNYSVKISWDLDRTLVVLMILKVKFEPQNDYICSIVAKFGLWNIFERFAVLPI